MCGIVGYFGNRKTEEVLIKGLKALEYRGYDSAGVAIWNEKSFKRVRAEGKLVQLESKLKDETFSGSIGIGHTRWATHGAPSERNAHPHRAGTISLVHNGIIENYYELKSQLLEQGIFLESDTDSEVVAHIIYEEIKQGFNLVTAVQNILPRLKGAFSILVVQEDNPNQMIAFKNGPPLLLGMEDDRSVIVASDVQALIYYTKNVYYLEDNEIALIEKEKISFFLPSGLRIEKKVTVVDWTSEQAEKQGYPHFMLKEIFEQPRAVAQALEPHIDIENRRIRLKSFFEVEACFDKVSLNDQLKSLEFENLKNKDITDLAKLLKNIEKISIVGCGTSYYAGLMGKYLLEEWTRIPVEIDIASEFRYRNPIITPQTLVIVVSQSGETADTLAALRLAKDQGAKILSICNVPRSTIHRESHIYLPMNAGVEIGVASTKAFTCTQVLFVILALEIARQRDLLSSEDEGERVDELLSLPSKMEQVLNHDSFFAQASENLKKYKGFLYMGRGANYPTALEGALKLKELAYMHAEGYAAGEMKHGPLALIDERMAVIMIAPKDHLYEKTVSNLEEVKARGGQVIALGTDEDTQLKELSSQYLSIPKGEWYINPILATLPLQLLAYHVASALGHDVDQPRNLAKSVTVE